MIERLAQGRHPLDAQLGERVRELAHDQADAIGERLHVGRGFGVSAGAVEVVEHGQHFFEHVVATAPLGVAQLSPGALPEVVEVGQRAQELVFELGLLGLGDLQRILLGGRGRGLSRMSGGLGFGGLGRRGLVFVRHGGREYSHDGRFAKRGYL